MNLFAHFSRSLVAATEKVGARDVERSAARAAARPAATVAREGMIAVARRTPVVIEGDVLQLSRKAAKAGASQPATMVAREVAANAQTAIETEVLQLTPTALGQARLKQMHPESLEVGVGNVENYFGNRLGKVGDKLQPLKSVEEVRALGTAFREMDPDILGLVEIDEAQTVVDFVKQELPDMGYRAVSVTKGNDRRMINLGILSRYPIERVQSHVNLPVLVPGEQQARVLCRDLLQATVLTPAGKVEVFVIHLKSSYMPNMEEMSKEAAKRGVLFDIVKAENLAKIAVRREAEADTVRQFMVEYEKQNPGSRYILMGDANDVPGSKTVAKLLGLEDPTVDLSSLITEALGPNVPTHHSTHYTSQIDILAASPGLRKDLVPGSVEVLSSPAAAVASDHYPSSAKFNLGARTLTK